jgi:two-component SAPR family response regulator
MEAPSLDGKRVLVVEDDCLIADALCDIVRAAGAAPIGPAGSAADAIKLAVHEKLDGVLLNVKLRDSDCMQVVAYLRLRKLPIVLVTGYDRRSLDRRLQDLPYLSKPVSLSALVEQMTAAFCTPHGITRIKGLAPPT